jgi:hypothetical protein
MAKRVVVGTDKAMGLATSRSPLVRFGLFWLAPLGARLGQPKQLLRNMAQLSIDYGPGEGRTTGGAFRAGVRLPWFPIAHGLSSLDLVGPSDFLLIIAAAGHEELRAVNERRHALWHLPGIGGDGIQTVVLANNRFYRGGVSRSESRVRVLPDTEGALHRLRANGAEAVLVRPDGYVLAADSTSRLAAIRDALLHVARPQRAAA